MKIPVAAAAVLLASTAAQAATIGVDSCSNGKLMTECVTITITGKVEKQDFEKFKAFADEAKQRQIAAVTVRLDSNGGHLVSGLTIGTLVHLRGYDTFVPDNTKCISVCAAIWLAGRTRYAATSASIGFHQAYVQDARTGKIFRSENANATSKAYYLMLGIPKPAIDFFTVAVPEDIYWLNADLAKGLGITFVTRNTEKPKDQTRMTTAPSPKATIPAALLQRLERQALEKK